MGLAPAGEIDRGVAVAIAGTPTAASEHPIGQVEIATDGTAGRAQPARRIPAFSDHDRAVTPGLFVAEHPGELGPARIGNSASQATVGQHSSYVQVFDDQSVVGLDQLARYLVQEMVAHICDVVVVTGQLGGGVTPVA